MTLEEAKDKDDILMLMMIQERDKQISLLEEENTYLKKILIEVLQENKHLEKVIKKFKRRFFDE